jgi:hypothetical protein
MFDDFAERMAAAGQVDPRKLAFKDRVLQVIAEVTHGFEDLAQPLVIGDVIADEIRVAHGCRSRERRLPGSSTKTGFLALD